jgi:hypothetical protein
MTPSPCRLRAAQTELCPAAIVAASMFWQLRVEVENILRFRRRVQQCGDVVMVVSEGRLRKYFGEPQGCKGGGKPWSTLALLDR